MLHDSSDHTFVPTDSDNKHLIQRFKEKREAGRAPHTMVIGHRGGFIDGPENSMRCFKAAIDNKLDGIEFDVWLTKDKEMIIMHGGDNGELGHYGHPNDYVFDWTLEQLQQLDIGEGEHMPTLKDLLEVCADCPDFLLNVEMKAPDNLEVAARYNHTAAAQILCNLLSSYRVAKRVIISSFSNAQLQAVNEASAGRRDFVIQSLRNHNGGPDDYSIDQTMDGVNLIYSQLNRQLIENLRETHSLLGVWFWTEQNTENHAMYVRVFETCGNIDFFYSDKPLEAMAARNAIFAA